MTEQKAEWHLLRGKEQAGPYPLSKMHEAIAQNILTRNNYVWRQGWPEWKLAGGVPELFPETAAAPPTAPDVIVRPADPTVSVNPADAAAVQALHRATAVTDSDDRPTGNYFVRHWRGDLSLGISFWVNLILVSFVLGLLLSVAMVPMIASTDGDVESLLGPMRLVGLVTLPLAVWQCLGVWRSASQHVGRGGKRIWAFLAKLVVVLGALYFLWGAIGPFVGGL